MMMKSKAVAVLAVSIALAGCGGTASAPGSSSTVSGFVSADTSVGSVTLRDSSVPPQERASATDANGAFSFDVDGLAPPFMITEVDASGTRQSALAMWPGVTNIDALTTVAATLPTGSPVKWDLGRYESTLKKLRTALAPLFDHYGVKFGDDVTESKAFRAMLKEVSFTVSSGMFTVTNRATGGAIYSAPRSDVASGVFYPENIPGGVVHPPPACAYTLGGWGACQPDNMETRAVTASPPGCTGTPPAASRSCTYVPPVSACTGFTYNAWTPPVCPASGRQSRTVATSSPAGCTGGSPSLTQNCTPPPPPPGICISFTYTAWTPAVCPASGRQSRTVATSLPAGCTGGSPSLTQTCTPSPPPIDGAALYTQYCASCHGNGKKGAPASLTQSAINNNVGGMGTPSLRALTPAQIQAIATAP